MLNYKEMDGKGQFKRLNKIKTHNNSEYKQ